MRSRCELLAPRHPVSTLQCIGGCGGNHADKERVQRLVLKSSIIPVDKEPIVEAFDCHVIGFALRPVGEEEGVQAAVSTGDNIVGHPIGNHCDEGVCSQCLGLQDQSLRLPNKEGGRIECVSCQTPSQLPIVRGVEASF